MCGYDEAEDTHPSIDVFDVSTGWGVSQSTSTAIHP